MVLGGCRIQEGQTTPSPTPFFFGKPMMEGKMSEKHPIKNAKFENIQETGSLINGVIRNEIKSTLGQISWECVGGWVGPLLKQKTGRKDRY